MKIYAISDLHLSVNNPKPMNIFGSVWDGYLENIETDWQNKVGEEDAVLMAGDLSWAMTLDAAKPDLNFFTSLKGKKVIVRGNHDYWWKSISAVRGSLPADMYALQNDSLNLGEIIVCGSRGWATPEGKAQLAEDKKIYERELIRFRMSLEDMSKKRSEGQKTIAMIHYPPFNSRFETSPFTEMFSEFEVDAVVYGHLHGKDSRAEPIREKDGVKYYLTSCDLVGNSLVEIEI